MKNLSKIFTNKFDYFSAKLVRFCPLFIAFSNVAYAVQTSTGNDEVDSQLQNILNVMFTIALAISLIKCIQIGIMFLMQPAGKAKAKESVFPWLVGVFICATFLVVGPIIIDLLGGNNPDQGGPFDLNM